MKTRKFLAMLLMLAMMVGMLGISASATANNTATFTFTGDSNVTTATVSGTSSLKIIDSVGPEINGNTKTCQVELSPNNSAGSATVTLKNGTTTVATLTVSLPTTTPTETFITSVDTTISSTTYVFYFVMETSYTTGTNNGGVYISLPDDGVSLGIGSSSGNTYTYANATTTASGFPQNISLRLVPGGSNYDTVSNVVVTLNTTNSSTGVTLDHYAGTYYLISFPENATTAYFSVAYKKGGTTQTTITFSITMHYNASTDPGSGIWAYLPAPGQFVNEGIGTGGWGDIHKSSSANLKDMMGAVSTTGVSLGAFGGYIVFDFGEDGLQNTATNKYGVDFIIYGNAFGNNAEPGCVQVAPDANKNGVPDKWYDVAGNKYYSGETVTMYYSDPTPSDNLNGTSTSANVPYSTNVTISGNTQTWANTGSLTTNTFHNHSWFPLARNYFDGIERNATDYSTTASGDMANVSSLNPASGSNPISVMENQTIVGGLSSTTVISYSGRKIPWVSGAPTNYQFGYADVHANGSSYGTAVNPYDSSITSGGDGIDISWAVNADGTPAGLTKIRFVRVYTGVQQINNPFGEVSTEVCGVYTVSGGGTGNTTAAPSVANINGQTVTLSTTAAGIQTVTIPKNTATAVAITGNNSTDILFLNDKGGTGTVSDSFTLAKDKVQIIRVIAKDSTTGCPYIGYFALMGT